MKAHNPRWCGSFDSFESAVRDSNATPLLLTFHCHSPHLNGPLSLGLRPRCRQMGLMNLIFRTEDKRALRRAWGEVGSAAARLIQSNILEKEEVKGNQAARRARRTCLLEPLIETEHTKVCVIRSHLPRRARAVNGFHPIRQNKAAQQTFKLICLKNNEAQIKIIHAFGN